jgi:hypothetical protein
MAQKSVTKRVTIIFPQHLIKEPVIYMMAKHMDEKDRRVIPNIRRARVTDEIGEVTLELEAAHEDHLNEAVEFLQKKGVKVEPVVGDVVGQ